MKVDMRLSITENSMNAVGREMTFDANSMAHIKGVLGNLYKNPLEAIVREYSTNAFDAHLMAGHDEPILVTLPTQDEPTFSVQDFGIGLEEEDVYGIFGSYGASTKRESNAFNGQLGFGSKSAFSYTSNFFVVSTFEGVTKTYSVFEDAIGNGRILLMSTESTLKRNGLKIIIPIKLEDVQTLRKTALRFYSTFRPLPVFLNQEHNDQLANHIKNLDKKTTFTDGGNKVIRGSEFDMSYVLMGNVRYPFPASDIRDISNTLPGNTIIQLEAEIGDINFTPSREAVRMDAKSKMFIEQAWAKFKTKIINSLKKEYHAATTLTARMQVVGKYYSYQILSDSVRVTDVKGNPIPTSQNLRLGELFDPSIRSIQNVILRQYTYAHGSVSSSAENTINLGIKNLIVVQGTVQMPGDPFRRAVAEAVSKHDVGRVYYINPQGYQMIPGVFSDGEILEYKDFIQKYTGNIVRDPVDRVDPDVLAFNYKGTKSYGSTYSGGRTTFLQQKNATLQGKVCYIEIADNNFIVNPSHRIAYRAKWVGQEGSAFIGMLHHFKEKLGYTVVGVRSKGLAKFREEHPEIPHYTEALRELMLTQFTNEEFHNLTIWVFTRTPTTSNLGYMNHRDMPQECKDHYALMHQRKQEAEKWQRRSVNDWDTMLPFIVRLYFKLILKKDTQNSDTIVVARQELLKRDEVYVTYPILRYIAVNDGSALDAARHIAQTLRKV